MDTVEDLLRKSDRRLLISPAVAASLDDVGALLPALATTPALDASDRAGAQAPRRRRRRRIAAGALGVALAAVAAPAAANYIGLHTGHYGSDDGRSGELLNLGSPEGRTLLHDFEQQYPLPAGGTWTAMEERWRNAAAGLGQAAVFEEAVGGEAECQWDRAWLDADAAGDATAAARAADVLAQVPTWHVVTAYEDDTHGASALARRVADAAAAGDRQPVLRYVAANCSDAEPGR